MSKLLSWLLVPFAMALVGLVKLLCGLDWHIEMFTPTCCAWCLRKLDARGVAYARSPYTWLSETL